MTTNGSEDVIFAFEAPREGAFVFTTEGSDFDTVMHARTQCGGEVIACNDDIARGNTASTLTVEMDAGDTVLIIVDGYDQATGNLSITVSGTEASCDDGEDNDDDGDVDCDDTDCRATEACVGGDDWPLEWIQMEEQMLDATNAARICTRVLGMNQ